MFIRLSVIFFVLHFTTAQRENHDWELAVVSGDRIELLLSNGSLAGEPFGRFNEFTKLKAVTFDNVRHQFVVSDMDQQNDTIFTVQLTKETEIKTIIEDLPDDVQGLAIDPITDILYWTDSINRTINYVHLNDSHYQPKILFAFTGATPQDVTVDICNRYLYWTNSDINNPTVERSKLDGSQHEILVNTDLHRPTGISIDYSTQRLYWTDIKEGIYFTVESTDLDGKERQVIYEGTHTKPFGVAVDSEGIYWTDTNKNVLWMLEKHDKEPVPKIIRRFKERPMGIIAKNVQISTLPQCEELSAVEANYESTEEYFQQESDTTESETETICFNGGYKTDENVCHCLRGYTGEFCEISLCHNYCVRGECYTSSLGYPQCKCLRGFGGKRCEKDMCDGFCLNGGSCSHQSKSGSSPTCDCPEGYSGSRCENALNICEVFCQDKDNDLLMSKEEVVCRCIHGSGEVVKSNFSSLPLLSKQEPEIFLDHFQDTAFLALCCLAFIFLIVIIFLSAYTCFLRRRPRIKKRIIVNKNITPLQYRPQPTTEHCEITIENCCNMNICETPCFEPPKLQCLQNKNDDKKKLLSNMENGEEILY